MRKTLLALLVAMLALLVGSAFAAPRFSVSAEGVIKDSQTGLEWVVGPDKGVEFKDAEAWVKGCKVAGGGWRMPTGDELENLRVDSTIARKLDPVFRTTGWWVWWSELKTSSTMGAVAFGETARSTPGGAANFRAFAVRSAKK